MIFIMPSRPFQLYILPSRLTSAILFSSTEYPTTMSDTEQITTKAYVVAERGGPFELRDVMLDKLHPTEVLVEIKYTGLCHTVRA
jgi:hypothetical protein